MRLRNPENFKLISQLVQKLLTFLVRQNSRLRQIRRTGHFWALIKFKQTKIINWDDWRTLIDTYILQWNQNNCNENNIILKLGLPKIGKNNKNDIVTERYVMNTLIWHHAIAKLFKPHAWNILITDICMQRHSLLNSKGVNK